MDGLKVNLHSDNPTEAWWNLSGGYVLSTAHGVIQLDKPELVEQDAQALRAKVGRNNPNIKF
jgi:hypothetical protein